MTYGCRDCGDAYEITKFEPAVRIAKTIRLEHGELTVVFHAPIEGDDGTDGVVWQCGACGNVGYTLEEVVFLG